MNTVTVSFNTFNTIMGQMTEMFQRKNETQPGGTVFLVCRNLRLSSVLSSHQILF